MRRRRNAGGPDHPANQGHRRFSFLFRSRWLITAETISLLERVVENVSFALDRFEGAEGQKRAERAQLDAESKQTELNRMYLALCKTNEAMMRAQSRQELFDLVCEASVLGGHFTRLRWRWLNPKIIS